METPTPNPITLEPDPVIEAYKAGIDVTLIDENLKLTVDQRIRKLCDFMRGLDRLRGTAPDDGEVREAAAGAR